MIAYFSVGTENATYECEDCNQAIAFAKRLAKEIAFWEFETGSILQIRDEDGSLIFQQRLLRPMH